MCIIIGIDQNNNSIISDHEIGEFAAYPSTTQDINYHQNMMSETLPLSILVSDNFGGYPVRTAEKNPPPRSCALFDANLPDGAPTTSICESDVTLEMIGFGM